MLGLWWDGGVGGVGVGGVRVCYVEEWRGGCRGGR